MTPTRTLPTRLIATTAACLACISVMPLEAGAADLDGPPPRALPQESWSPGFRPSIWQGFYYGLSAGFGFGQSSLFSDLDDSPALATTEPSGFVGSVTAGYNWQIGSGAVFGVEGDLGLMDVTADDTIASDGSVFKTQLGPLWGTVRARLGMLLTDRMLVYATGGAAFMQVDEISLGTTGGDTSLTDDFRAGYVVGAGAEYALSENMSIKAEYLYMDFGSLAGVSATGGDLSIENEVQLVRAGVNFKF